MLHLIDGKFAPQTDEEYMAILHLLNEDLFCYEYLSNGGKVFLNNMTEEEKEFVRSKIFEKDIDKPTTI